MPSDALKGLTIAPPRESRKTSGGFKKGKGRRLRRKAKIQDYYLKTWAERKLRRMVRQRRRNPMALALATKWAEKHLCFNIYQSIVRGIKQNGGQD